MNQRELANCIGMTEAAISRQVESLTQDKLLKVTDDPTDRRRKRLILTPKGNKKLKKCIDLVEDLSEELFNVLSKEEIDTLKALLIKILQPLSPNMQ